MSPSEACGYDLDFENFLPNPAATTTERVPKTRRHSQLRELRRHLSKIIRQEVLKRIAPVARSVSWNVTAVAGNAWRILTSRIPDMSSTRHWRIITADGFSIGGGVAVFFWAPIRVEFSDGRRWRRNDDHDKVVGLTTDGG